MTTETEQLHAAFPGIEWTKAEDVEQDYPNQKGFERHEWRSGRISGVHMFASECAGRWQCAALSPLAPPFVWGSGLTAESMRDDLLTNIRRNIERNTAALSALTNEE